MTAINPARRWYTNDERCERASRRVATHIRELWEETGVSDTRLLDGLFYPDALAIVGRSIGYKDKGHREHVVPRLTIIKACICMLERNETDEAVAKFVRDHTKIVLITRIEQQRLDGTLFGNKGLGLKQKMPDGWKPGDDIYARLTAAGIEWLPHAFGAQFDQIQPFVEPNCLISNPRVRHPATTVTNKKARPEGRAFWLVAETQGVYPTTSNHWKCKELYSVRCTSRIARM